MQPRCDCISQWANIMKRHIQRGVVQIGQYPATLGATLGATSECRSLNTGTCSHCSGTDSAGCMANTNTNKDINTNTITNRAIATKTQLGEAKELKHWKHAQTWTAQAAWPNTNTNTNTNTITNTRPEVEQM